MEAKLASLPARLKEYVVQGPRAEEAAVVSNENDYNGLVEEVRRRDRDPKYRQRRAPGAVQQSPPCC